MATTRPVKNALRGQSVTLEFREGITKQEIDKALQAIYDQSGCTACGLIGFDLDFKVQPPNPILDRIRIDKIAGVTNVTVRPLDSRTAITSKGR